MIRLYGLSALLAGSPVLVAATGGATGGGLGLGTLVQTGVTGSLAAMLLVFARTAYLRETQRADRLEGQLADLNRTVIDRFVPALENAARTVSDATDALSRARRDG